MEYMEYKEYRNTGITWNGMEWNGMAQLVSFAVIIVRAVKSGM